MSSSIESIKSGQQKLKIAEMSREMSEQNLSAEFEKFRVGESNIKNLVDAQKETDTARISEATARIDLIKSITAHENALGELPEGVTIRK